MSLHQKIFIVAAAVAVGLVASAAGYAQPAAQAAPPAAPAAKSPAQAAPPAGPASPNQRAVVGRGQGRRVGLGRQGQPAAGAAGRLNLTQAQRDQITTLREAQRRDWQDLREKMRTARQQLQQAMRADIPDEAAVRSAAGAVAALQADRAALQARARSQFMKVLTPEQQAQMSQARARATQRAQRAQRAMRVERQMMQRNRMMYQNRMMRQRYPRWWRGWI
jgi:Spy/CpxP family protein refolding chaperone